MNSKILQVCIICTLASINLSCSHRVKKAEIRTVAEVPNEWRIMDQSEYSIRYPESWEMKTEVSGTVFCLLASGTKEDDRFRENINLVVEVLPREISLDEYAALSWKNMSKIYKLDRENKYITNDREYYCRSFSEKPGESNDGIQTIQYYYIKSQKAYILTFNYEFTENSTIISEGEKIMDSFILK